MWWIFGGRFFDDHGNIVLELVTENFTTFFTARKEDCHLKLTLRASSPKNQHGHA